MITILKHFTWAAANNGSFQSGWIRIPEQFQNWQLVCLIHSRTSGSGGGAQLTTSWDMNSELGVAGAFNLATLGLTIQNVTSGVGPYVQLRLDASADTMVTVSFFLIHKTN